MRIEVCDVCGAALDLDHDGSDMLGLCPNGLFDLDFHRLVTDEGRPSGWHHESFHICPQCHVMVNQAIFEKIKKIQETQFHPTAIVPIRKFPPEPIEIETRSSMPVYGCSGFDG